MQQVDFARKLIGFLEGLFFTQSYKLIFRRSCEESRMVAIKTNQFSMRYY